MLNDSEDNDEWRQGQALLLSSRYFRSSKSFLVTKREGTTRLQLGRPPASAELACTHLHLFSRKVPTNLFIYTTTTFLSHILVVIMAFPGGFAGMPGAGQQQEGGMSEQEQKMVKAVCFSQNISPKASANKYDRCSQEWNRV